MSGAAGGAGTLVPRAAGPGGLNAGPPAGKLRYANNSNYKNDVMIRKEVRGRGGGRGPSGRRHTEVPLAGLRAQERDGGAETDYRRQRDHQRGRRAVAPAGQGGPPGRCAAAAPLRALTVLIQLIKTVIGLLSQPNTTYRKES